MKKPQVFIICLFNT